MAKLGVIQRLDRTGLGYQSRAYAEMLQPVVTLDLQNAQDVPTHDKFDEFLSKIDVLLTAETPYIYEVWNWAKARGIKTICAPNWEFFDGLVQPNMPHPDRYIIPSYWHLEDFRELFPNAVYLPPPTPDFPTARKTNKSRTGKRRFVHIIGANAIYDRNGWSDLRDCLKDTQSDFELVVYSQKETTGIADPRVKYHIFDVENQEDLYTDFDALILPRRYGGLCLPMQEALMAGLPVIMPDTSPNNKVLPKEWLVPARVTASFEGRSTIDVHTSSGLAEKIDWLCTLSDEAMLNQKKEAYEIGYSNYSYKVLYSKYIDILMK